MSATDEGFQHELRDPGTNHTDCANRELEFECSARLEFCRCSCSIDNLLIIKDDGRWSYYDG